MSEITRPLTGRTSIEEWLSHPVGGPILTGFLAQGGQDASSLAPVKTFPLERLVALSQGKMPQEAIDALVLQANDGVMPVVEDEEPTLVGPWVERVTPGRFDGQTIIVTGAGSGIGRATASRIAREGGRVIAVDISEQRVAELVAELPEADIVSVIGDISSAEGVAAIVEAAGEHVHGLANVAGIMDDMTPLHEVSDAVWERVFSVNVDGMFRLTRAVLPLMLAENYGSIVNVASEAGIRGSAAGLAYTASKHAVVGMTKSAAFMYTGKGIRVNAVAPGPVATNIQASFASTLGQERIGVAMQVLPAVAEATQLAASITFLLSPDGTNINGAILPSDGGWSAV